MKKFLSLFAVLFVILSQKSLACEDEACLREQAEKKYNAEFPTYLTWKYCDSTKMDFMRSTVRSLDKYRNENFGTKYKGPLKNTRNYLKLRKEWLQECDDYLSKTMNTRIFVDDKSTQKIFAAIDRLSKEFSDLIEGASYSSDQDAKVVMNAKIDTLFQLLDDQKVLMHLKGKYVVR